jgi:hypothetical protein
MSRLRLNINRDWKFFRGDVNGAEQPDFDDSQWQPVGLPHTFDLPYFRTPEFYVGVGWYRRRLLHSPSPGTPGVGWGEGRAFLEFDGAFQVAEVFVNGQRIGEHRGGYTGFSFEITDQIRPGDNLLSVRVNNNWSPSIQPRAGEHIFSGGLYRDVHLLVTHSLRFAPHTPIITTPSVSNDEATIAVTTELDGDAPTGSYQIRSSIIDPRGKVVATAAEASFKRVISNPLLWHPDDPKLYSLRQDLYHDEVLVDTITTTLGLRWFTWTPDRGFFLNGEHLYLRGANVHQDHSGWGIAITQAACERDVRLIKEAGFNFVRGAHYPHHPAFADACDRLGLIFWSENAFWGKGGFGPEGYWTASAYPVNEGDFAPFEQSCKQQLEEMIRINRNHPSIMAWSMTNEAFFTYNLERAKKLMSDLVALSRRLDPTRPAAIGGAQRGDVDHLGDIAGYNGDGARLFIDPGVPNMVSEYGAISKPHDAFDPFFGDLQSEKFPWRSGEAIWCGFDYGSIAGRQGLKGILDHARLPKRSWHWYRKHNLSIEPPPAPVEGTPRRLRLSADKTTIRGTDATDDVQLIVTVCDEHGNHINNSPPITLTIESGPGEFPTGRSITFDESTDIKIVAGQAAMAFRSYHGGESVIRAASDGLEDATITITTQGEPKFVPGQTPLVSDRSYVPPKLSDAAVKSLSNIVNVARDRPCRASSEAENHPARLANDGDPQSRWLANSDRPGEWWMVDLEGFYQVSGTKIVFDSDQNYRYIVELSQDGKTWELAVDRRESVRTDAIRNDIYPPGAVARYVRVTITSLPPKGRAALSEVEVHGVLSVR